MKKRIYTRTGDRGETSLFSGQRVAKNHHRVETYGTVDELNSIIGVLAAFLPEDHPELEREIRQIQSDLLRAGSWLATTPDSAMTESLPEIDPSRPGVLEAAIDRMEAELTELSGFLLPAGQPPAVFSHVARTVCRRAERRVVALAPDYEEGNAAVQVGRILLYLNRLSDYLFVLARYCNHLTGTRDILWKK